MENPTSDSESWPPITYTKVRSELRKALKLKSSFLIGRVSSQWEGRMENPTSDSESWPPITYTKVRSELRKALKLKRFFLKKSLYSPSGMVWSKITIFSITHPFLDGPFSSSNSTEILMR
jgi:hypothetical protein